jgi:hypothetical protein
VCVRTEQESVNATTYQQLDHQSASEAVRWEGHMSDGIGVTQGPTPLAFLSATADELLLCGNRGSFRLARSSIRRIGRGGFYPWFFGSVRIHHNVRSSPAQLEFLPRGASTRDVLARLKSLGYPVR